MFSAIMKMGKSGALLYRLEVELEYRVEDRWLIYSGGIYYMVEEASELNGELYAVLIPVYDVPNYRVPLEAEFIVDQCQLNASILAVLSPINVVDPGEPEWGEFLFKYGETKVQKLELSEETHLDINVETLHQLADSENSIPVADAITFGVDSANPESVAVFHEETPLAEKMEDEPEE